MATHRKSILQRVRPDTSGNVFPESYAIKASNDRWPVKVWIFNDSGTDIFLYGRSFIPKNYVGTAKIKIVWTATGTTGNIVWGFKYRAVGGDDSESLDQTSEQEALTVTDAAPGAVNRRLEASIDLTSSNLAVDDDFEFEIYRNGASGSDTLAFAGILFDVYLEYADA